MITTHSRPALRSTRTSIGAQILARLIDMLEVARQRRHLAALSDCQLKDIGLSRADVAEETAKPFWR